MPTDPTDIREVFESVASGDAPALTRLIDADPSLVHARDADGATALHHAAFNGHQSIMQLLIDRGADLNARDSKFGATPAGWAIHFLRDRGALLAVEIEDALFAIRRGDSELTRRLVQRHPQLLIAYDAQGIPLADHARRSGDLEIAALFATTDS